MNHCARVLVCRSAPLATAYCDQLRHAFEEVGHALLHGEVVRALEAFESVTEPAEKLLVFTTIAAALLQDAQHPLRPELVRFSAEFQRVLERVADDIAGRDFARVAARLEAEVEPLLVGYHRIGPRLTAALEPRLSVA